MKEKMRKYSGDALKRFREVPYQLRCGNYQGNGSDIKEPLHTITTLERNAMCAVNLIQMNNHCDGRDVKEPIPTITAGDGHFGEVRAFLIKYYGQ